MIILRLGLGNRCRCRFFNRASTLSACSCRISKRSRPASTTRDTIRVVGDDDHVLGNFFVGDREVASAWPWECTGRKLVPLLRLSHPRKWWKWLGIPDCICHSSLAGLALTPLASRSSGRGPPCTCARAAYAYVAAARGPVC